MPHISDVVIAGIRRELRKYASVGKLIEPPGEGRSIDSFGVQVLYSRTNDHDVRFAGVTHDGIKWDVVVDFRAYSREYQDLIFQGVRDGIRDERRKRRGKGPILLLEDIADEAFPSAH